MLSRASLSVAGSSRLASWTTASTPARVTVAALSTPSPLSRSLSSTSSLASGRGGERSDRPQFSNRNNNNNNGDRSDYRPRRRDDGSPSNQRSGGSNAGNPVAQESVFHIRMQSLVLVEVRARVKTATTINARPDQEMALLETTTEKAMHKGAMRMNQRSSSVPLLQVCHQRLHQMRHFQG